MTAGLLMGLGEGLQKAGETYGKFKMYDIEQKRKDAALQEQRSYDEGRQDELLKKQWDHQDIVREDEQLAELEKAKLEAESKVEKARIEADIKRYKYMNEIIGVDANNQPITRQRRIDGYDGPVYKMSDKDGGKTDSMDIKRAVEIQEKILGEKFAPGKEMGGDPPSKTTINDINLIREKAGMPPLELKKHDRFLGDKWTLVEKEAPAQKQGGGLLTNKPAASKQPDKRRPPLDEIFGSKKQQEPESSPQVKTSGSNWKPRGSVVQY